MKHKTLEEIEGELHWLKCDVEIMLEESSDFSKEVIEDYKRWIVRLTHQMT